MQIKSENVKKWVKALRSGKFRQITGHLADKNGYCCLGVACEVAIANGVRTKRTIGKDETMFRYSEERDALPPRVRQWLGFPEDCAGNPALGDSSCAELNDKGESFELIASMIEAEYLAARTDSKGEAKEGE